jgi:hypothetical protein
MIYLFVVGEWLKQHGIAHRTITLSWPTDLPDNKKLAKGREERYSYLTVISVCILHRIRYRVLLEECRRIGAKYLMLGHQQDDQLETFLMRLGGLSGTDGEFLSLSLSLCVCVRVCCVLILLDFTLLSPTMMLFLQDWRACR